MSFVHLRCFSEYSLLESAIQIRSLVNRVRELNQPAVALTDHNVLYGAVEFYKNARTVGVKPIIGIEACLNESMNDQIKNGNSRQKNYHVLLLARDITGFKNIIELTNIAHLSSFDGHFITKDDLAKHSQGLICTTGCLDSEIPYKILAEYDSSKLRNIVGWYYEVFGKENFFFELQDHGINDYQKVNKYLLDLKSYFDSEYIATNDVRYINSDDVKTYELLRQIRYRKEIGYKNWHKKILGTNYLKSSEEMEVIFGNIPGALSNTLKIAEMCNVEDVGHGYSSLSFRGYHLPEFSLPENLDAITFLRNICFEGLNRLFSNNYSLEIKKRLDYELDIISKMGFSSLFLMVWDLCKYAKEKNIWWSIRGSANGSLVVYTIGVSHINPIEHKLVFERFINPGRISMPDFDLEFTENGIAEISNYITQKYGSDNVARIAAFGVFGAHDALRETGNVLGIRKPTIEKIIKLFPHVTWRRDDIKNALENDPTFQKYYQTHLQAKILIDAAIPIENLIRSLTIHSSGIIIGHKLRNVLPLCRPPKGVRNMITDIMTQFDMVSIESLGYLKQDILHIPTLSVMQRASRLIKESDGLEYDQENIPTNNKLAFDLLGSGDGTGLFQVEGKGLSTVLKRIKPTDIGQISDALALYRPGPMPFIQDYIARRRGEVEVEYRHQDLVPIFEDTYGIPVYQEQIMQLATTVAGIAQDSEETIGYSPSMADELRKSISRKRKEDLEKHEEKFISAAIYNGYSPAVAEAIYSDITEFARYAFNKSHSIAYAKITCQNAFLKANYPYEYMAALISERIILRKSGYSYISSARKMGLNILAPDVNKSELECTVEQSVDHSKFIRLGLIAIKHLGRRAAQMLIAERLHSGPFKSFSSFMERCKFLRNALSIRSLYEMGALDSLLELELNNSIDEYIEKINLLESL